MRAQWGKQSTLPELEKAPIQGCPGMGALSRPAGLAAAADFSSEAKSVD